jgi:DNA-binding HxlR family transcriptional regulator
MNGTLCPRFHKAIELIGSRWTGAVLRLLMGGRARFAELRDSIPDISDRMLSERLRILEEEGLIERHVLPDPPIKVEYELTQKGRELNSSLAAIGTWAEKWLPADAAHAGARVSGSAGARVPGKPAAGKHSAKHT